MRRRIVAAVVTLALFSYLSLLLAYNIHLFFSGQLSFSLRMGDCIRSLAVYEVRLWFLLLEATSILLVLWMLLGREYINYKSGMIRICPGIATPKADGQGQYGTARWLDKRELGRVFTAVNLDAGTPELRELMRQGRADLEGYDDEAV